MVKARCKRGEIEMARYILTKVQIKRLIEGKYIVDGRGRKFSVDSKVIKRY